MQKDPKQKKLSAILEQAKLDHKGDYSVYHNYRRLLEELELSPKDFERAVRKLSNILKV